MKKIVVIAGIVGVLIVALIVVSQAFKSNPQSLKGDLSGTSSSSRYCCKGNPAICSATSGLENFGCNSANCEGGFFNNLFYPPHTNNIISFDPMCGGLCDPTCLPVGTSCSNTSIGCCAGLTCKFTNQFGGTCTSSSSSPPPTTTTCAEAGGACSNSTPCCDGLECEFTTSQYGGTCKPTDQNSDEEDLPACGSATAPECEGECPAGQVCESFATTDQVGCGCVPAEGQDSSPTG